MFRIPDPVSFAKGFVGGGLFRGGGGGIMEFLAVLLLVVIAIILAIIILPGWFVGYLVAYIHAKHGGAERNRRFEMYALAVFFGCIVNVALNASIDWVLFILHDYLVVAGVLGAIFGIVGAFCYESWNPAPKSSPAHASPIVRDAEQAIQPPSRNANEARIQLVLGAVLVASIVVIAATLLLSHSESNDDSQSSIPDYDVPEYSETADDEEEEEVIVATTVTFAGYTWTVEDFGGLKAALESENYRISGYFDTTGYRPSSGGWNGYSLVLDLADLRDMKTSVTFTVEESWGTEFLAGIGLRSVTNPYDDFCLYGPYFYTSSGVDSIGNYWEAIDGTGYRDDYDSSDIVNGDTITLGVEKSGTTLTLFLDDEEVGHHDFAYYDYELFLHVGVKYTGTYADVVFEHFSLEP